MNFQTLRYLITVFAFSCMILQFAVSAARSDEPYILVDAGTGEILTGNKIDHQWHPASLTKLMTAYVTFKAIQNGEIKAGSPVIFSRAATRQPPSKMGYKQGTSLRIDAALKIIIVKSANDVSHALGEAVAGTLENFIARMNFEAKRLGMTNTRFTNPHGLHNARQITSARDMAILSIRIKREFPQYAELFRANAIKTPQKTYNTYNLLLSRFPGADGMKTGFVCASGFNMAASATRNGKTLIAVVLGTASQTDRAISAARLLSHGFSGKLKPTGSIYAAPSPAITPPRNMRPILCTEAARAARYNPGAGLAKLQSEFLTPPKSNGITLAVSTGGITADPSDAYLSASFRLPKRIPIPIPNPALTSVASNVVKNDSLPVTTSNVPLPTPRPR